MDYKYCLLYLLMFICADFLNFLLDDNGFAMVRIPKDAL